MLRHVDSDELSEWMAYERAFGPLGNEWTASALIAIYAQLQNAVGILAVSGGADADDIEEVPLHPPTEFYKDPELRGIPEPDDDENEYDLGDDEE
jgi:hypothetical protein